MNGMHDLNDYRKIVGDAPIDELFLLGERLSGKSVQNINSTAVGGGVAEILKRMIPLLRELNINASWDVIKGDEKFYNITKKFHNGLHGVNVDISENDLKYFRDVNDWNSKELNFDSDIVFIHDSQPIALIEKHNKDKNKWIWRCHVDVSTPLQIVWEFLEKFISKYEASVFSAPAFSRHLPIRQVMITPSIDPLSEKNKDLTEEYIDSIFEKFKIDQKRPIITQISRFDYLKDPIGVIKTYQKVKKYNDCQLILAGGGAADDPEGSKVLAEVKEAAGNDKDIFVLELPHDDLLINALQRGSTIILQKSLKEGFGLTVSEALWKGKPVIASAVGGIPLQITHEYSGILTRTIDGTAKWIKRLLNEPEYAKQIGRNGKEYVRQNFLITRHLRDYLMLFLSIYHDEDIVTFSID